MLLSRIDRALSGGVGRTERLRSEARRATGPETGPIAIGERYESVQGGLEQLASLAQQMRALEPLLGEIRQPLEAEYETRKNEYAELIQLRAATAQSGARIEALSVEVRRLTHGLSTAERRLEEAEARTEEHADRAQQAMLDADQLRTALSQTTAQAEAFKVGERDGQQRIRQLEQDLATLGADLNKTEARLGETEAARARSQRDHSLALDENAAMKRRLEETVSEIARLSRIEASLESQLTTERARAASEQAEAARAMRALEAQGETARQEAASLQVRLDTLIARADRMEALNAELSAASGDLRSGGQAAERRVAELQTRLDRALERIGDLEAAAEEARTGQSAMDAARLAAVDRAETLSRTAGAHEKALARSEAHGLRLQAQMRKLETDRAAQVEGLVEQIETLKAELETTRAHAAITTASLDAARRERMTAGLADLARSA